MNVVSDHYGLTVSDMDTALEFYHDKLGLEVIERSTSDSETLSTVVGIENARAEFAFLDTNGVIVELIEFDDDEPRRNVNADATTSDVGVAHFCFEVDDIESWYEDLAGTVETVSRPQTFPNGTTSMYVRDPDGSIVELTQDPYYTSQGELASD